MWEVKQQREELARELVRKDGQVKELQQRLESGDGGCKLLFFLSQFHRHANVKNTV